MQGHQVRRLSEDILRNIEQKCVCCHLVSRDGDGRSALQLACEQGQVEVAELLGPGHQDKVGRIAG